MDNPFPFFSHERRVFRKNHPPSLAEAQAEIAEAQIRLAEDPAFYQKFLDLCQHAKEEDRVHFDCTKANYDLDETSGPEEDSLSEREKELKKMSRLSDQITF